MFQVAVRIASVLVVSGALVGVVACGGAAPQVELSGVGKKVQVGKAPPPGEGEKLGPVEAVHGGGCGAIGMKGDRDSVLALLRNEAGKMGATYVQITKETKPEETGQCPDHRWIVQGVAYR